MQTIAPIILVCLGASLLFSARFWPATWLIVAILPLAGVVLLFGSSVQGVPVQGVDLSILLLLLLSLRRIQLPSMLVRLCFLLFMVSILLSFGGVTGSLTYTALAMKISIGTIVAVVAGYKTAALSASYLRWFFWGLLALIASLGAILLLRYQENGVGLFDVDPTLKQFLATPVGSSNYIASIAVLIMGSAHFLAQGFRRGRVFYGLLITVLGLAVALVTQSKWGTVCALVVATVNVLLVPRLSVGVREKSLTAVIVSLLVLWGFTLVTRFSVITEVFSISTSLSESSSGVGRLEIWEEVWSAFGEKPILGSGLGWEPTIFGGERQLAHNTFLELLGQGGILFLFSFCALLLYLSVTAFRAVGHLVVPILTAGLLSGMLEPTFRTGLYDVIFFSLIGMCVGQGAFHDSRLGTQPEDALPHTSPVSSARG